jgi:hypothetical protein
MDPYVPQYESPEQKARRRAERNARLLWVAIAIPLVVVICAFGYSDQAPAFLRDGIRAMDASMGYPILKVLSWAVR